MSEATEAVKGLENLKSGDHICFLYNNKKEQLQVATCFLAFGLQRGEKCLYIVSENTQKNVIDAFNKAGINIQKYINSGQFGIIDYSSAYLSMGYFDPDDLVSSLKENAMLTIQEGYKGLRVTGEMDWALNKLPNLDKLIEYESKLNSVFQKISVVGMCQYNRSKFPKEVLVNTIEVHPVVVLGKLIYRNICGFAQRELWKEDCCRKVSLAEDCLKIQKDCPVDDPQLLYDHCKLYQQLDKLQREVVSKLVCEILELEPNEREAFCELVGKKGYGSLTFVFKAGSFIGLDWQSSHRTHQV